MPRKDDSSADETRPPCSRQDCDGAADFWLYDPGADRWGPICERHAVHLHPSLEVDAWLESGYARPVELARPDGLPAAPRNGRNAAFRDLVEEAMGWAE